MNKNKKLVVGLVVIGTLAWTGKHVYNGCRKVLVEYAKDIQQETIDKTVDDFVKAVVTCRQVTIESKHNGKATVRLVID